MKGISKIAIAMLVILSVSMISALTMHANAAPVTTPNVLEYVAPNGQAVLTSLLRNPEFLKVHTINIIHHDTWIHVLGEDAYGENVEAKTLIPAGTPIESDIPLVDYYSQEPVAFTKITDVYQEGGEHCNSFQIHTLPCPKEQWLGTYHQGTNYVPQLDTNNNPVEPCNPDPLKVAVNWKDINGNGLPEDANHTPDPGEFTNLPTAQSTITIIGLDQNGDPITRNVVIPAGSKIVRVDPALTDKTWSTVCMVTGGDQATSYYIFTDPEAQRPILTYHIMIHEIELTFSDKNILADGTSTSDICITLLDIDQHEVHWAVDDPGFQSAPPIEINMWASGGKVEPSVDIEIQGCSTKAETVITADTNGRLIKVTAIAYVPEVQRRMNNVWVTVCPSMTLTDSDNMCFDGLNSAPTVITDYPYRAKVCRIEDGIADVEDTCDQHYVVYITLTKGCNLISIPFQPDEQLLWSDLPGAEQSLICVCTFMADGIHFDPVEPLTPVKDWFCYSFCEQGPKDPIPLCDGLAYWVKAKENCTLVLSGTFMAACNVPPAYKMAIGWNLVGVTEIKGMTTCNYLGSLDIEDALKLWGPVWVLRSGEWLRNPSAVYPGEGLWVFTYDGILAP
jgi:hypothetical protein